ncbi:hypothetical protein ALC53_13679 [Atta colombica]|uniref:C2H2-type domain-containing protein n=1 Tax=Atta colombica TaxID=520822 RepID=A0A195AVB5_9HYME|nr:hypothetical protein ALC53_13679 [Atta colombica]
MLKTFKCLQCNSTFDRASQLDYHHRSLHLGERSQICQICEKGFFRKADLRTHLNIHLGTNFYICEICGRKFSHISNLIRHCRMHTGIKPYSCSICDKNFTQMSSLARHIQMIHGIPKEVVQQYYNSKPMLHLVQTETGEQFYEFIISNLVEKMQDASCTKDAEVTIGYPSNICRDSQKINSNLKGNEKIDQIEHQQALDDLVDINNEFNCTQFDFYREEKNYAILSHEVSEYFKQNSKENECVSNMQKKNQIHNSGNLELLENETHVDFDKYIEINLEAFERLNYENCNEKFLEFVEVADIGIESSGYKELSMVRLIQNDGEQLLELLQDSQAEQEANQDFIQANNFKDCSNILQNSNKRIDYVTTTKSASTKNIRTSEELKKSKIISRKFQCLVCKKAFSTTYNYKQHIGIHFTDQQKFHCKDCGVSFAWKSTLNKHIANNHTSDGPQKFVCEICPKVYSTLSQVNEHVKRDHLKQRNHVCLHCGKSFFKRFDLKTHSRTHTNERPYECRICGKRFHHQSHIIRHERTHSGERPYVCDICQRTFTQPSSLKAHKQKHQQIRMDFLDYQIDEDDPIALAIL